MPLLCCCPCTGIINTVRGIITSPAGNLVCSESGAGLTGTVIAAVDFPYSASVGDFPILFDICLKPSLFDSLFLQFNVNKTVYAPLSIVTHTSITLERQFGVTTLRTRSSYVNNNTSENTSCLNDLAITSLVAATWNHAQITISGGTISLSANGAVESGPACDLYGGDITASTGLAFIAVGYS